MKHNLRYFISLVITGLLLFLLGWLLGSNITGAYNSMVIDTQSTFVGIILGLIAFIIIGFFVYLNKVNIKQLGINLVSTLAILCGFYVIFKYVHNVKLISGLIALSFGVWAIIWTLSARSVLSKGSTIRGYATSFFVCLVFVLIYSLWDIVMDILNLQGWIIYIRYIVLIFVYTTFVFTAYRMYRIGKEFGFAEESSRLKKLLTKKKK